MARGSVASLIPWIDNPPIERQRDPFALALRASRSDPPGRAADGGERHAIYGAALQQFDELLAAAQAVGAASQPLLLFYALSQGGRAVVAARGDKPHLASHGLSEDRGAASQTVLHRRIKRSRTRDGSDAFGAVSRAEGSPDFVGSIELGAIWAAIPRVHALPVESWRRDWRLSLDVERDPFGRNRGEGTLLQLTSMSGNPLVGGVSVLEANRYPTLPSDAKAAEWPRSSELGPGNWFAYINLPTTDDKDTVLDQIAPRVYGSWNRALVPTLPGQSKVLSPLMLWWLLLFGLSIFARYHPGLWAASLDVQRSKEAVPLESVLEQSINYLPALIHEAIFTTEAS